MYNGVGLGQDIYIFKVVLVWLIYFTFYSILKNNESKAYKSQELKSCMCGR